MRCGERKASGTRLHDVMTEATANPDGDLRSLTPDADTSLAAWIGEHAHAIESELAALQRVIAE